jgi:hypothetical protein
MDYAVTGTQPFTDEPIQKGQTLVKASHIVELRNAIDALRAAAGLGKVWQSATAPSGVVTATPVVTLFTGLNEARAQFGGGNFAYSNGVATPATNVVIRSEHIQEIRNALR